MRSEEGLQESPLTTEEIEEEIERQDADEEPQPFRLPSFNPEEAANFVLQIRQN
jgi:hypothetical protein